MSPNNHLKVIHFFSFNSNFPIASSELIDSRAKLMESPKILVIHSADEQMLTMAPEGSFLGKLSKKSTFVIRCEEPRRK